MRLVHLLDALLCCAISSHAAESYAVLKAADVERDFAQFTKPLTLYEEPNLTVGLQVYVPGALPALQDFDRVLLVRAGRGLLTLGQVKYALGPGDVVMIPHGMAGQFESGRLNSVVLQFGAGSLTPPLSPYRDLELNDANKLSGVEIANTFSASDIPQRCGVGVCWLARQDEKPESHDLRTEVYLVETGAATIQLGGRIEGARVKNPDTISGDRVEGYSSSPIEAGDLIVIPRNTAHHVLSGPARFGYLVIDVWSKPLAALSAQR